MFIFRKTGLLGTVGLLLVAGPAMADGPTLGVEVSNQTISAWDISISPTGEGLPEGKGTATDGEKVFAENCAICHGQKGQGKPANALVGGIGSLASAKPQKTVGSYWPYATTLFDYARRAMPLYAPQSLSASELYAVTAYILALNGVISGNDVLNAKSLPKIKMPNRDGFVSWWPKNPR